MKEVLDQRFTKNQKTKRVYFIILQFFKSFYLLKKKRKKSPFIKKLFKDQDLWPYCDIRQ